MTHTFSIIIPVYNAANTLCRCIDSILSNCNHHFEIILVDDGSNDNSSTICDRYAGQSEQVTAVHTDNHGVSAARNTGLDRATGEYILFIDPDDWVPENYLDTIDKEIEGFDLLVFSNSVCFNTGGKNYHHLPDTEAYDHNGSEKCIFSLKNSHQGFEFFGYIWNKCYRRDIIETNHIRFHNGLSFREDNVFNEHYYSHTRSIKTTSDILYYYSFSETGLTHKRVSQAEYQILAQEYSNILCSTSYEPLARWNAQRALFFMAYSSLPSFHTPVKWYKEIRRFVRSHTELADSIKYKCYFLSPLPIGLLSYYVLEGSIFLKNSLKRQLA